MADTITLKSSSNQSRYMKLVCEQTKKNSADNTSTIKWTLSTHGNDSEYISTGPTEVVINGTTVYSKSRVDWSSGSFPVSVGSKSGTLTVKHTDDGTKSIKVSFSTAIYTSTVSTYSDTWKLDTIPRYGTSKQSLNSKTETSIKMNWSSDSTVDYLWYSKDDGKNWTGVNVTDSKGSTYTISGLSANTTYKIKTRIRRKDSQLTTDSSALSVTTYDYPYCTSSPNFILGNAVTLKFYNPLKRSFKFYIIGNGTQIAAEYSCSTTEYTGVNGSTSSVPQLYATIPNAKSGKYKVKVVYGSSTKTRDSGNTYSINEKACYPTFSAFSFKDTKTASITNSAFLIKGLSSLTVEIDKKMETKNSATPKNYIASLGTTSKTIGYSATGTVTTSFGTITTTGTKSINVRAYDSRGLSTLVAKNIVVYDYYEPVVNIDITRENNYGEKATLKVSGRYAPLTVNNVNKNKIESCKYHYRETGGDWSDWITLTTTLSSGKFTCNTVTFNNLDNDKSFEFEVEVTDSLGKVGTDTVTLNEGQGIFFISTNNKTCYINGKEVATVDNVRQSKYYTQLATNTDINNVVEYGTYRSVKLADTQTMSNLPTGINGGFTLHVVQWTSSPTDPTYIRQELVYSRYTYVRASNDLGANWSAWEKIGVMGDIYPVGSVYISSTNTNPASKFGGTWSLIDKGFKSYAGDDTSIFTAAANVVTNSAYVSRVGCTIRIRLSITVNTSMSDTGMLLGTFNWAKVGFTILPMGYGEQVSYSDGANGGIVFNIAYTGAVNQLDVFDVSTIESGKTFALDITFTVMQGGMYDSFCDKFYWQRTA